MIISHKNRFIFFAVPKTATHAVRTALREHMGPDDWEQQVLYGKQSLPIPEIAAIQHGHISVRQIRPHLDADVFDSYFKFGFVRNPYDRYISLCFFLNRGNPQFASQSEVFLRDALNRPRFRQRILVKPQVEQLVNAAGDIGLDYVGRYETLQDSYNEICNRIGIPSKELASKNKSEHRHFADYYDDSLKSQVADFYRQDLERFDYDFPEPTN